MKKIIIIRKTKKKNGAGWAAAQSRNCIAIQGSVLQEVAGLRGFVLQEGKVYCNLGVVGWELYLRILHCIVIEG